MKQEIEKQQIESCAFFERCADELRSIAVNSKHEQEVAKKRKRIQLLRDKQEPKQRNSQNIIDNIVVDYIRSKKLNYCYTVLMREKDLVSDDIILKPKLVEILNLDSQYMSHTQFSVTVIELMLEKISNLQNQCKQKQEYGVQVELITKDNTVNNRLINEIQISAARRDVQSIQKKHYQSALKRQKQQLKMTIKDDLKKEFDLKLKQMKSEYQSQVKLLKQKNKEFLVNNPKLNPKIQEYLTKIEKLESQNLSLSFSLKELQKQKITHNCFKNSKIIEKQEEIRNQRANLLKKKNEYELALKNLHTSVEQLALKKQKMNGQPKQTDLFLAETQKNRKNKDYLIEQIYGRMFAMDKRIENLTKDNDILRQQNRQLMSKVKQVEQENRAVLEMGKQKQISQHKTNLFQVKPKSKDAYIGVSEQQIKNELKIKPKEHAIDQIPSSDSEQDAQMLERKKKYKLEAQRLTAEMQMIKNKLRFFVQDFA